MSRTPFVSMATATFEGIVPNLERRYRETESEFVKSEIERLLQPTKRATLFG